MKGILSLVWILRAVVLHLLELLFFKVMQVSQAALGAWFEVEGQTARWPGEGFPPSSWGQSCRAYL
jgi:hypothetical protein